MSRLSIQKKKTKKAKHATSRCGKKKRARCISAGGNPNGPIKHKKERSQQKPFGGKGPVKGRATDVRVNILRLKGEKISLRKDIRVSGIQKKPRRNCFTKGGGCNTRKKKPGGSLATIPPSHQLKGIVCSSGRRTAARGLPQKRDLEKPKTEE